MFRRTARGWVASAAVVLASVMIVACSQSDPGVTTAVKAKFAADDTVKAYKINVDTNGDARPDQVYEFRFGRTSWLLLEPR